MSRKICVLFFLLLLFCTTQCAYSKNTGQSAPIHQGGSKELSPKAVRQIADPRAIKYGFDLSQVEILIGNKTARWDKLVSEMRLQNPSKTIPDVSERKYCIVIYRIKQNKPGFIINGGEYYVFVDKYSGEVLLEFAGK